ncbi:Transcription factor IIS N-terminal protein [Dioscorea alata]|uniref:Transcription factor IIS N-terminal protein n=1 Tax=Dioscorea alata TaxID=55571 RepID=A0ACB7VS61_DIOAL|nr:Transcription factor IIS N-terminal protein [Dioscorea alata]
MASEPRTMEWWKSFFRSSGVDIFEVIQRSIVVAVLDYPNVFQLRRDEIAETLFTCHLAQRGGDGDVLSEKTVDEVVDEMKSKRGHSDGEMRENKVDGMPSNCSYDVAEALTEEMEEESLIVREVLRIKEVLCNKDESDSVLFESLRRLELMGLSVEALKETEIGRAVNGLRKHNSKQIRHLVRTLIDGWKVLVDEWVNATAAIADNSPVSVHLPIADEEEGLPSPPLDEGALFITQTANIQLSEFFDGMDDDGNIRNIEDQGVDLSRNSGVYDVKCTKQDYERRHMENRKPVKPQQPPHQLPIAEDKGKAKIQDPVCRQLKQQEAGTMNKQSRNDYADNLYSERPSKQGYEQKKQLGEFKSRQQDISGIQRKPSSATLQDKSKYSEEVSDKAKLEAAKRKLHERYQEAENAKKQRTIQVMELHDIPKQANNFRQPFTKQKNNIRNWANVRR